MCLFARASLTVRDCLGLHDQQCVAHPSLHCLLPANILLACLGLISSVLRLCCARSLFWISSTSPSRCSVFLSLFSFFFRSPMGGPEWGGQWLPSGPLILEQTQRQKLRKD